MSARPFVSFAVSREDGALIDSIVERFAKLLAGDGPKLDRLCLAMDITATHANGCPLQLEKLLGAPEYDFVHDVMGIQRHINRSTGRLGNHFLPRCAERQ